MVTVSSLVLFAADLPRTAAFYRAVGVPFEDEEHEDGTLHVAADLDGVHVAVYAGRGEPQRARPRRSIGSAFPGFYVDSLEATQEALVAVGAPIIEQHEQMDWGCRIVVEDPDGHAVEINQRLHCERAQ